MKKAKCEAPGCTHTATKAARKPGYGLALVCKACKAKLKQQDQGYKFTGLRRR